MRNFRLILAYDGGAYCGWQAQDNHKTIQVTVEEAVAQIIGQNVRLHSSGRTDTGVHALGQVASFLAETHLEPAVLHRAINAVLPNDIALLELCEVPLEFHPRFCAKKKHYRYVIYNGPVRDVFLRRYAWHYKIDPLDTDAMQRAAKTLVGTHDFTSFESSGAKRKTSVRTVFLLEVSRGKKQGEIPDRSDKNAVIPFPHTGTNPYDWITLDIIADGFLYNMVRAIVGTLVEVGRGVQPESWPEKILLAKNRQAAGPTAPSQGLFLVDVDYRSE